MYFFETIVNFDIILNFNQLHLYFLIPIIVVIIILLISCRYDLKLGIIPNYLSKLLIVFGIIYNAVLAVIFSNYYFLINAIILGTIIFFISLFLWKIRFWGGGDLKLFTGMAISLAFLSSPIFISLKSMTYMSQNFFYFPIISILFNSILVSFPFIIVYLFVKYLNKNFNLICKTLEKELENKNKYYLNLLFYLKLVKLFFFNFNKILHYSSQKKIDITSLKEGMILDKYYFQCNTHYEINYNDLNIDINNINLYSNFFSYLNEKYELISNFSHKINESELYYIESANGGGLTKEDIFIINYLFELKILKNKEFTIKIGIPFSPSLTLGFFLFIIYGDLISIISHFFI